MEDILRKTASLIVISLLAVGMCTAVSAAERQECVVCGMYLDLYEKTRLVIHLNDDNTKSTCSLACAAEIIDKNKGRIKEVKVADFLTGELFDAYRAYFLEGSDVPGVMTYTSRIAFFSKAKALAFQKKHGGRIITFDQALKDQMKDKE